MRSESVSGRRSAAMPLHPFLYVAGPPDATTLEFGYRLWEVALADQLIGALATDAERLRDFMQPHEVHGCGFYNGGGHLTRPETIGTGVLQLWQRLGAATPLRTKA